MRAHTLSRKSATAQPPRVLKLARSSLRALENNLTPLLSRKSFIISHP